MIGEKDRLDVIQGDRLVLSVKVDPGSSVVLNAGPIHTMIDEMIKRGESDRSINQLTDEEIEVTDDDSLLLKVENYDTENGMLEFRIPISGRYRVWLGWGPR